MLICLLKYVKNMFIMEQYKRHNAIVTIISKMLQYLQSTLLGANNVPIIVQTVNLLYEYFTC